MKRVFVKRALDGVILFEMKVAQGEADVAGGMLEFGDAMELATDLVAAAAEWYDTGDSPWEVAATEDA